jgi:RND family efflux transporter MFP subunit
MLIRLLIPSIIILTLSLFSLSCSSSNAAENNSVPPRQVTVKTVISQTFRETVTASGRLAAKEELNLSFKTGGIIQKILVEEGQKVRKNQLLAVLQLDEIQAQVRMANLSENKAKIDLENAALALQLAERDYRNAQGLFVDSVATLEQLENAEVQLANAKNQMAAAQTGLELSQQNQTVADYNLKYSKIVAPTSGTILKKMLEANEIVGPGRTIFLLGSNDQIKVIKISATDKDIININLGDPAEIRFDAYPEVLFKGSVEAIAGQADPFTGTYEVELKVDPGKYKLLSGFIGAVKIQTSEEKQVLVLDAAALVAADGNKGSVFVVQNDQVEMRELSIFRIDGENILVQSGLKVGEQVVVSGAGYLEDGQAVRIIK